MQITKSKIQYLSTLISVLVGVLVWVLICRDLATAGSYTDSAHGSTTYGVNRSGTGYPIGDCAHCHDPNGPDACENQFMLFYDDWVDKTDLFCFKCHSASTDHQQVTNYPYCVNFGGQAPFYGNIEKQFCNQYSKPANCGSRHGLDDIRDFMVNDTYNWGFNSDPDPCVACHNPHADQRNYLVAIVENKLSTAIRRPVHYKSLNPAETLWGDDASERMNQYASQFTNGIYKAPYYGSLGNPDTGPFEPANNSISDGSNLPDYATFCLDCHQYEQYDTERSATVRAIDWSLERHGGWPANTCDAGETYEGDPFEGTLRPPYADFENSNYILSCLDCHEPHGTKKRLHLIRRMISGEEVGADNDPCDEAVDWASICARCHYLTHSYAPVCTGCHYHGKQCPHPQVCIGLPCF